MLKRSNFKSKILISFLLQNLGPEIEFFVIQTTKHATQTLVKRSHGLSLILIFAPNCFLLLDSENRLYKGMGY